MRRHHILILCAALLVTLPLWVGGCSCGHDFDFHLQSWLDAVRQMQHGTLLPRWIFSGAYNAGEPRFVFYPPLSWMLGALLTMLFPITSVPAIFTLIAVAAAGLAMYRLASEFAPDAAALLATALYMANPYMLFTAFERTAYAELLAAAWMPLLLLAVLRKRPTVRGIALPVALLWLTNAPAAVMGSYALALIFVVRVVLALAKKHPGDAGRLAATAAGGTALGLALPAFYLLPAAYEQRFVQIAMATLPNMRIQDNFLFGHTGDGPHDDVLHTASLIAVTLLIAGCGVLAALWVRRNRPRNARDNGVVGEESESVLAILALLTLGIGAMLTPLSAPLWRHLPELAFLQFPWRLLAVLASVLGLSIALLFRNARIDERMAMPLALVLVAALTFAGIDHFRQGCDDTDLPAVRSQMFTTHQGVEPTDESTPLGADNDALRLNDPPYWLAADATAYAPGTTPAPTASAAQAAAFTNATPAATDTPPPSAEPEAFTVTAPGAGFLILNLRDYPRWAITLDDPNSLNRLTPAHVHRDDGLVALRLWNGGTYTVHVAWQPGWDERIGLALSLTGLGVYGALIKLSRSRRIEV